MTRGGKDDLGPPKLTGISTNRISVGQPLTFTIENAAPADIGWVDVVFQGTFESDDGGSEEVDMTVALLKDGNRDEATWADFGYGKIPFGSCAAGGKCSTGCFRGTVKAINRYFDGKDAAQSDDTALQLSDSCGGNRNLGITSSIVVRNFLPFADDKKWIAPCKFPARVALPSIGFSYLMDVEAVGFEPDFFEFTMSEGLVQEEGGRDRALRQSYSPPRTQGVYTNSPRHRVLMKFAQVPQFSQGYRMNVGVRSGGGGGQAQLNYSFVVRSSFTVFPKGSWQTVQYFPPEPHENCTEAGPLSSTDISYTASKSNTKTRSFGITEANNWSLSIGNSYADSLSIGDSLAEQLGDIEARQVTDARSRSGSGAVGASRNLTASNTEQANVLISSQNSQNLNQSLEESDKEISEIKNEAGGGFVQTPFVSLGPSTSAAGSAMARDESDVDVTIGNSASAGTGNNIAIQAAGVAAEGITEVRNNAQGRTNSRSDGSTASIITNRNIAAADGFTDTETNIFNWAQGIASTSSDILTRSETETVSESRSISVLPNSAAQWWVQLVKRMRYADIVGYDLCGIGTVVGEMTFSDYVWNQSPAQGTSCEPPPKPCLAKPECRVASKHCDPMEDSDYKPDPDNCGRFDNIIENFTGSDSDSDAEDDEG